MPLIQVNLRPSKIIILLLGFYHGLAGLAISLLPIAIGYQILLIALIIANFLELARQQYYPKFPVLIWQQSGQWLLAKQTAVLQADSIVSRFCLILNFKLDDNNHYSVIIVKDSLMGDSYRQLLARLSLTTIAN